MNGPRRLLLGVAVPALSLTLAFALVAPRSACPYGCSRMEDTVARSWGCITRQGSACYECYYAEPAGFRTCFENPEGTSIYCTDIQQVPF
jgi:hypothetical protein